MKVYCYECEEATPFVETNPHCERCGKPVWEKDACISFVISATVNALCESWGDDKEYIISQLKWLLKENLEDIEMTIGEEDGD